MAIVTSNIGARENTVKNAIDAPRLIARSFHHPTSAVLRSAPISITPQLEPKGRYNLRSHFALHWAV